MNTLVYVLQLTAMTLLFAAIYLSGSKWLGRFSRRILFAGLLGVLGVTTFATFPAYVIYQIPVSESDIVSLEPLGEINENDVAKTTGTGTIFGRDQFKWMFLTLIAFVMIVIAMRVIAILVSFFWLFRQVRDAQPIVSGRLNNISNEVIQFHSFFEACSRLRRIRIVQTSRISSASTFGFWNPTIVLPSRWIDWTDQELRVVLAHEFEHVRRGDFLTRLIIELVRATHFYHPLVCWLANQYRLEQENSADWVAATYTCEERYERLLIIEATKSSRAVALEWMPSFSFGSKSLLRRRIEMLRKRSQLDERTGEWLSVAVLACVIPLTVILCGVRASAQADTERTPALENAQPQSEESTEQDKTGFTFQLQWGDEFGQRAEPAIPYESNDASEKLKGDAFSPSLKFSFTFPQNEKLEEKDSPPLEWSPPIPESSPFWFNDFRFYWSYPDLDSDK